MKKVSFLFLLTFLTIKIPLRTSSAPTEVESIPSLSLFYAKMEVFRCMDNFPKLFSFAIPESCMKPLYIFILKKKII